MTAHHHRSLSPFMRRILDDVACHGGRIEAPWPYPESTVRSLVARGKLQFVAVKTAVRAGKRYRLSAKRGYVPIAAVLKDWNPRR
jgi:hypothetical protein